MTLGLCLGDRLQARTDQAFDAIVVALRQLTRALHDPPRVLKGNPFAHGSLDVTCGGISRAPIEIGDALVLVHDFLGVRDGPVKPLVPSLGGLVLAHLLHLLPHLLDFLLGPLVGLVEEL